MAGIMGTGAGITAGWYPGICIIPGYTEGTKPSQVGPYLGPQTTSLQPQAEKSMGHQGAHWGSDPSHLGGPRPCLLCC